MRATIYIDKIADFDNIREMADLAAVPSYPVRNMKAMRDSYYDKPNLVIEGKTARLAPFVCRVRQMGFEVHVDQGMREADIDDFCNYECIYRR